HRFGCQTNLTVVGANLLPKLKRQTEGTSDQVPRSGPGFQPRVAATATLGDEFQSASTPMGLRPLPCVHTQRSRRAATLGWRSLPLRGMKLALLNANSSTHTT